MIEELIRKRSYEDKQIYYACKQSSNITKEIDIRKSLLSIPSNINSCRLMELKEIRKKLYRKLLITG